ncbi:MAG: hypothetical protein ACREGI_00875, partial [Candidatus Levyibacteriota bacterium]
GIVADKHSIGGVPGTRTSLILVPIIAAAGFLIPKSSSRAITTPDGTADDMETLANVEFSKSEIYKIIKATNGCIVWGGSFHIAPADDVLIHVEKPLLFESYDKIIVSIMAKKVAFGSNHIVIDIPYGATVKVHSYTDAEILKNKFLYIAKRFAIEAEVCIHEVGQPAGRGIGPVLETREALRVLEQQPDRPLDLEKESLRLASMLLDLCLKSHDKKLAKDIAKTYGTGEKWAQAMLSSGKALQKMKDIINAQGGDPEITSQKILTQLGTNMHKVKAEKGGVVQKINNRNITTIAKILGAPVQKGSGIYLDKKIGEKVNKGDTLYTMHSQSMYNLREAQESVKNISVMEI